MKLIIQIPCFNEAETLEIALNDLPKHIDGIDEIEYGVHTKALTFLLKMYLTIADECQFVVTTHDLSLLNTDFLRRDAVRMFEKNEHGETRIMKRLYVHSTMNYLKAYEKLLDEQLGLADIDIEAMEKYRGMIHDYLSMQTADVP